MYKYLKIQLIPLIILTLLSFTNVSAKETAPLIKTVNVSELKSLVKSNSNDKPMLLLVTSTDKSCGPCLLSNKAFQEIAPQLKNQYNFSRVVFNPYLSIEKEPEFTKESGLMAMPWIVIYYKGKQLTTTVGQADTLKVGSFRKYWKKITKP